MRFARARGSKAGNERHPEEATSWLEMKRQMMGDQKLESEKKNIAKLSSVRENNDLKSEWADFENTREEEKLKKNQRVEAKCNPRKKKETKRLSFLSHNIESVNFVNNDALTSDKSSKKVKDIKVLVGKTEKRHKKDVKIKIYKVKKQKEEVSNRMVSLNTVVNINQGKNKLESLQQKYSEDKNTNYIANSLLTKKRSRAEKEASDLPFKRKKSEKSNLANREMGLNDIVNNSRREEKLKSQQQKNFQSRKTNLITDSLSIKKRTRAEKEASELPFKRKKLQVTTIRIDDREVEIRHFDGFPVMKDDWERLTELKKKMVNQGIPKNEIMAAMKLERRRAEKSLARERKKVCFNCRQSGHLLSDCPEVGEGPSNSIGSGICFKCGSTEHKQSECRVTRQDNFKFAKCFVCGEEGHISRQCPDNPRGLYPKGGGCRVCGDVTHLRKDCPQEQQQKEENTIRLEILEASGALEALDLHENKGRGSGNPIPKAKRIKFV